ncbi:hypothetical protein F5148DRAFT_1209628 [Russula earlei]|uniref:Uncharacterized protein n=1 Tax=Russula earlei TaxID=71964 RepID=A0ACC0U5F5_9AGAM|nr:hypothetical protein F5148DRAFT_1209628 [Russula earlei]
MFGESESESPRVPSPWDVVLASTSVDKLYYHQDELLLPKLAAEVEEGNVEYKLHLISPSTARFARLVTQMKWRILEGGGQAIYELGVADSGTLVGLAPDDLRATLDTLHAMAAEIGARVLISKEIEVNVTDVLKVGFRAHVDKRHGSRDSRRSTVKVDSKAQAVPIEQVSPYPFDSATASSTPSSLDSTSSLGTDMCSLASDSSPPSSPSLPASSVGIPVSETAHEDDSLLIFPLLADCSPRCLTPAGSTITGRESFIGYNHIGDIPEKPPSRVRNRLNTRELHHVPYEGDVGTEPVAIVVTAVDALPDSDDLLLTAFGQLEVSDSPSVPEVPKRTIVEALIIRELEAEEGFLDFSSF